ncbi:MAG TPA: MFS transporter [Terriglobia bacterium]|nr:MFS transporter [Terriglobia bacterium]
MIESSYRALLGLPSVGRLLVGMQVARISQSMVSVTTVLYALSAYHSPALAGLAAFFSVFPGLIISPVAGALLDRHGRTRLVVLDYLVAMVALGLIGALALLNALPAWLLIVIAAVASLTAPLSASGLRSLFPQIVPVSLWERVNAIDSIGYVIAMIVGPPLAALIVSVWGGGAAFLMIGLSFGVAAAVTARFPDPRRSGERNSGILQAAWEGLVYTWRNPTLRGLGFSLSALNLTVGTLTVVVPLIVLERLRMNATVVGLIIAAQGLTGAISAMFFGRVDTRNRERIMLVAPMVGTGLAVAILLVRVDLVTLVLVMALTGFFNGPLDVALFTLRQRRTAANWMGRAFAVSMAFNYAGVPLGSALAGVISGRSIEAAIAFGALTSVASGAIASRLIPGTEIEDR